MRRGFGRLGALLIVLVLLAVFSSLWLFGGTRSAVDWHKVHALAFESDDWGLAGFVPSDTALADLDRTALASGRFPEVYWGSTLEDSTTVHRLADLMGRHRDRDDLPAVFQANYIMSSLDYALESPPTASSAPDSWRRHDLPDLPPAYARAGLWSAVKAALTAGVWQPELHGSFHYDPQRRRDAIDKDQLARHAALHGVLVFPDSHRSWELGPWRSTQVLAAELDHSLDIFRRLFGRHPHSVIAPDYVWDERVEALWESRGLTVIQAKREQRHPGRRGGGIGDRLGKVFDRTLGRLVHPGRTYLERNCRLEAVQADDWRQVATTCFQEIQQAWARCEPAVVETHRVNFVHLRPEVVAAGFQALARLLELLTSESDPTLVFLTDDEIAQLTRTGTSCSLRGANLVVRNYSHSHKMVAVPEATTVDTWLGSLPELDTRRSALMLVAPMQTLVLPLQALLP